MKLVRKTKIICTIGPASSDAETLRGLVDAGMNVARFNLSHGTHDSHASTIRLLRDVAAERGEMVAILFDTKGPEIRTGAVEGDGGIRLMRDDKISLTTEQVAGTTERLSVSYTGLPKELSPGNHIYIADGIIDLEVVSVTDPEIHCVVRMGGTFGARKNVNVPGVRSSLPGVTDRDREDIRFGVEQEIDFIAASFVRRAEHVEEIRKIVDSLGAKTGIIAKIEDEEGVENIDDIIRVADGIMIARGDLGVQLPTEQVPLVQKRIARKANGANKAVIVATQMLDSMILNFRPTRAELTDVANAIFDGADSVMLSGETASGAHPIGAVEMMDRIARSVEASPEYWEHIRQRVDANRAVGPPDSFARSTCEIAESVDAAAIICPSLRGNTPRRVSKYRPRQIIIAATTRDDTARRLLLYSGIVPVRTELAADSDAMIHNAIRVALESETISPFDKLVSVAGIPVNSGVMTNTIRFHVLGTILARGSWGRGGSQTGRIVRAASPEYVPRITPTDIVVVPRLGLEISAALEGAAGIIVEEPKIEDSGDEKLSDVPIVAGVQNALESLEDGLTVTIDGAKMIVYEGVVMSRIDSGEAISDR